MLVQFHKAVLLLLVGVLVQGCITMGNERFTMDPSKFAAKYPAIRQVVIEEAANNGFGTLASEVKPSEFNDLKGQLFFQLRTANGIDQLWVEFVKRPEGVAVWTHGAGTRGNANSAVKAITARLNAL